MEYPSLVVRAVHTLEFVRGTGEKQRQHYQHGGRCKAYRVDGHYRFKRSVGGEYELYPCKAYSAYAEGGQQGWYE